MGLICQVDEQDSLKLNFISWETLPFVEVFVVGFLVIYWPYFWMVLLTCSANAAVTLKNYDHFY